MLKREYAHSSSHSKATITNRVKDAYYLFLLHVFFPFVSYSSIWLFASSHRRGNPDNKRREREQTGTSRGSCWRREKSGIGEKSISIVRWESASEWLMLFSLFLYFSSIINRWIIQQVVTNGCTTAIYEFTFMAPSPHTKRTKIVSGSLTTVRAYIHSLP